MILRNFYWLNMAVKMETELNLILIGKVDCQCYAINLLLWNYNINL